MLGRPANQFYKTILFVVLYCIRQAFGRQKSDHSATVFNPDLALTLTQPCRFFSLPSFLSCRWPLSFIKLSAWWNEIVSKLFCVSFFSTCAQFNAHCRRWNCDRSVGLTWASGKTIWFRFFSKWCRTRQRLLKERFFSFF